MHRILRRELGWAVKWRILVRNPADAADPPKVKRAKMSALGVTETALLLAHFRPTCMFIPVVLGALGGLCRGEETVLRWRAGDLAVS